MTDIKFLDLYTTFIDYHATATNHFDKRDAVTVRSYRSRRLLTENYLSSINKLDINATEMDVRIVNGFMSSLLKKYSHNYSARVADCCRMVLHFGVMKEYIEYNKLATMKIRKIPPGKPAFITGEEIERIRNYTPTDSMLAKAKEMALFQVSTGFDFGDLITVREQNIVDYAGRRYIVKARNKTNNEACIPLTPEAEEIFRRNRYNMRLLSNPLYNRCLKDIAKVCDIKTHLMSHTLRKSRAYTYLNEDGLSLEAVSKILGHAKIQTTQQYYVHSNINVVAKALDKIKL